MPTSKFSKVMQAVGEVAYSRSPILGQAMEVADVFKRPDHANDPHATRMGNIKNFVVDSAIQRSPVLNKMAQAYDFIKSLRDDQTPNPSPGPNPPPGPGPSPSPNPPPGPNPNPSPGPNPPPGPGPSPGPNQGSDNDGPDALPPPPDFSIKPGKASEAQDLIEKLTTGVQEVLENSPSKVVDFFDDEKNIYYKSMEASRTHLEKIVEMLKEQSEMMKKSFKIQEEANERAKNAADLSTVGRGDLLPNSLTLPPDMAQFEGPGENQAGKEGEGPGWIEWLKDNAAELIIGGGWGLSKIKSLWKGAKGAVGGAVSMAGKALRAGGSAVAKGVKAVKPVSRMAKAANAIKGFLPKAAPFAKTVGRVLGKLATPLAVASTAYDMYEFENYVNQIAEERGISKEEALAIAQAENREGMESTLRGTPGFSQIMQMGDWTQKQGQNLREWWNKPKGPTQGTGIIYSDTNATISRMMQDYTKDGDGFTLSPDAVRQKITSSLDIINKSNTQAAPTTTQQPPLVVGGPTNISNNNGGNVTNVYNSGRDSLMMPQLAFNLPSTVY